MSPSPRTSLWSAFTHFDATQLAPWLALRNALGVAAALGVGLAPGNLGAGFLAATGALNTAFSEGTDPDPRRATPWPG